MQKILISPKPKHSSNFPSHFIPSFHPIHTFRNYPSYPGLFDPSIYQRHSTSGKAFEIPHSAAYLEIYFTRQKKVHKLSALQTPSIAKTCKTMGFFSYFHKFRYFKLRGMKRWNENVPRYNAKNWMEKIREKRSCVGISNAKQWIIGSTYNEYKRETKYSTNRMKGGRQVGLYL